MSSEKLEITGIEIITGESVIDSWGKVFYGYPRNHEYERYLIILKRELSIYPAGYIPKAGIKKIVLGRDLSFDSEYRGAIPDPYRSILYLSVNGAYDESDETYLIHVIHHEIHHMLEYAVWKNMYFNWVEWERLNPEGFSYGKRDFKYASAEADYYSVTHPLNGFLNLYSMTAGEEDRCELAAFLLTRRGAKTLTRYLKNDSILRRKATFISDFINRFAGVKFIDIDKFLEY